MANAPLLTIGLPEIRSALDASFTETRWFMVASAATVAGCLLGGGALADRQVFLGGLACFMLWSLGVRACDQSHLPDPHPRCAAVAAAMLLPKSRAPIAEPYRGADRGRALGAWPPPSAPAPRSGLSLASHRRVASWRWLFLVNVPIVALAAAATATGFASG